MGAGWGWMGEAGVVDGWGGGGGKLVLYCVLGQAVPILDCCGQEGRGPVLCPWAGGSSP